jgi:uncharacterized membrane protein
MPPGTARIVYIVGLVLMVLCIVEVALVRFARIDLTGVRWSPIALGGTGIILMQIARFMNLMSRSRAYEESEEENEDDR